MDTPRAVLKPLVLEFGAAYTKIGYVGEPEPRHIIKTELILKSGKQVCVCHAYAPVINL